ncbi:SecDF P1 head subdomain-containing protein [Pontibacillus marinus]|uniref:SecDF P1 head subdomain domain-containing protein n=1 Tax=Pontibacillus marinus BH030004 = DSM 16465 TaxID=1385511 RepID=A0A0A5FUH5_9BACI|nr:hypothetical protein [Pontibacillus marinus]KGX83524.1 hypothetical protein N783_02805 [Pontibacillus marinus BH030004 = DSM 16465]
MKRTGIYLGTIIALTAVAAFMFMLLPTNSKSTQSLQFTSQNHGEQAIKELMDYTELEYELTSNHDSWTVKLQEDISDERFEELKTMIQSGKELSFRDHQDNLMLSQDIIKKGSAESEETGNGQPVVTFSLTSEEKFYEVTSKISNTKKPNNVLVMWFGYEEGQTYLEERDKEDPAYLSAPKVNQRLKTSKVQITGNFTKEETHKLAEKINISTLSQGLTLVEKNEK